MKLKGRSILVLALLLFGGYAYYDYVREQKAADKDMNEARLLTVNFEQVDTFEVQKGDQKIVLKRNVDGWELVEPIKDLADNNAADDFVKNAVPERIIEVAREGKDVDWSLYGLDKPLGKITFKTTSGEQNVFEISEKRNFEENVFARRDGGDKVLVLNSAWQSRVNRTVNDFRDRRFLRNKIASVDEIKLKNAKGTVEVKRVDGKWVANKKDVTLDQNKVRELLTAIADAKGAEVIDNKNAVPVLKELFTLSLKIADKTWKAEVGQAKDLLIFAKISEYPFYLKMEAGALDKMIALTLEDLKEAPPQQKKPSIGIDEEQAMMADQKDKK
ncbi:DUF4340 domain-containing protein [Bdellovibrio sp. 22V]|uniref:DUF4340 domain-containing protein n=1 Tax=Bdellovibrio TaxID=958 RepID=UPI002543ED26|nr:DUF4340 domain-containing protein [Bdellovibrio sp. 22V]WII71274.1 DUF4340 domain-containing protein [Bdellovibrio sp. 22V]